MAQTITILAEPELRFGHGQSSADPKEGLFMYGPVRDTVNPIRIRVGVVGTPNGIALYQKWVEAISKPISVNENSSHSVFFPGFRELFSCDWNSQPDIIVPISGSDISRSLHIDRRHEAIHTTVGIFCDAIARALREEESRPALWFVIVPDEVYELGRPRSHVPSDQRIRSERAMNVRLAKRLSLQPSLFEEDMHAATPYYYDLDFHNQLKFRLLKSQIVTQIVRESTLQPDLTLTLGRRRMQDAASVAWNLSLSTFYKASGRPWRLSEVRPGLCYVGLVFKKDSSGPSEDWACCAAQMFLTNGDGMVFKGRLGPWYAVDRREFHLKEKQAAEVAAGVVKAYRDQTGSNPLEIIFHGKTRFDEDEWKGFLSALPNETKAVGYG